MKRKGFTLIELLAVIVVIAIIAIIAFPVVTNVVEKARKNAAEVSTKNYIEAVEQQIALNVVKGIEMEDGTYQMVLTIRGAFADIFWFSLFHELGHIVNGDVSKVGSYIDAEYSKDEKKEDAADSFASCRLLDQKSYERFVRAGSYSYASIKEYAQTQAVPPYVVIGRLQKEERIPWTWHQKHKLRYKWAEA